MAAIFNYTEGWQMFFAGQFVEGALWPYWHLMGAMFWGLIALFTLGMIYMKTENFGTTGIAGIMIAATSMIYMPQEINMLGLLLGALSITLILFNIFVSRRE